MLLAFHTPGLDKGYLEGVTRAIDPDVVLLDYAPDCDMQGWVAQARCATGGARCIVFGHGLGGLIAQAYASAHPQSVDRLLLCSTAPSLEWLGRRRLQILEALERTNAEEFARACHEVLPAAFADPRSTLIEMFAGAQFCKSTFGRAMQSAPQTPICRTKTLILHGRYDRLMWLEEGGQRLLDLFEDAELIVFERSGHFPFLEQAGPFVMAVDQFLREAMDEPQLLPA